MSKTTTPAFALHQAGTLTFLTFAMKVGPLPDDSYIRVTALNKNLIYDDGSGDGPQTYYASTGAELTQLSSTNDLAVNNGEARTLVERYPGQGINEAMIENGSLTNVEFVIYKVNYRDTTMSHEVMGSGPIGEVRKNQNGLITLELRSWTDLLRQNSVAERDSITCRVKKFGSQYGEERFPCLKDITGMWVNNVPVTSVGSEPVRLFTASSLAQVTGFFAPGLLVAVNGANQGVSREIGNFTAGGVIDLKFAFRHPMAPGDLFNIRPDCNHKWGREEIGDPIIMNSCLYHGNHPNFRGEPFINISNVVGLTIPGAADGGFL